MLRTTPIPRLSQMIMRGLVLALGLTMLVGLASAQEGPTTHLVQDGETLSEIATMYGVTAEAIIAANEILDPNTIESGVELLIPDSGGGESLMLGATPTPVPVSASTYTVQPRDTIFTIAAALGVDPAALIAANFGPDDDPNLLFAGQVLVIPGAAPQEGIGGGGLGADQTYVVQPRDSLSSIAVAFDVAVESIAYANGLERPYVLMPGQVLVIPGDAPPFGVVPPAPGQPGYRGPAVSPAEGQGGGGLPVGDTYVVQPRDTLDTLAQVFDIAVESLIYANELEAPYVIMPGQVLVIPAGAPPYGVVPPFPGQQLPAGLMEGQGGGGAGGADLTGVSPRGEGGVYIVQAGDTILSIAFALDVPLLDFLRANARLLNAVELEPGTELVIP